MELREKSESCENQEKDVTLNNEPGVENAGNTVENNSEETTVQTTVADVKEGEKNN